MFKDNCAKVREAISWVMARICEHHADVIANPQVISQFMFYILEAIKDRPRISNQCCSALMKLAISLESANPNEQENALSPYFSECLKVLYENTTRDDFVGTGIDLMQASFVTITTMVQNSTTGSIPTIYQLMVPILQKLEQTVNSEMAAGQEKASTMQDLLCGCLQVILIKVGHLVEPALASNIILVIIKMFK